MCYIIKVDDVKVIDVDVGRRLQSKNKDSNRLETKEGSKIRQFYMDWQIAQINKLQ